ncbi:MAG: hypothetical protein PF517_02720 [Salinivirgaceae bacterium]|nr:hypothetical protein [Salinivirgaceae bacterium]
MKNGILFYSLMFVVLLFQACSNKKTSKYFGQRPPGNKAELFAPGIISLDDRNESMITFSPDGKQCYFTEHHKSWQWCKIMQTVLADTGWSQVEKASFSNDYSMCPSISADGEHLFVAMGQDSGMHVYQCESTEEGWSKPTKMNSEISSSSAEYSCHPSSLGSMFVCSWRSGAVGGCDGWRIPKENGKYQKAENLGLLNSIVGDCVWAPGPNEEYLIFQSRRPAHGSIGGFFETDLFITFALPNKEWSQPQNLGSEINSDSTDGFAWVSHDGKYLFFSSNRLSTYDIYWVSLDSVIKNTPKVPLVARSHKPGEFEFYQKYETADDSITSLYFNLDEAANVKLTIFDRANENPKIVLNENRAVGKNNFVWNGHGYKKGEYLCELQVTNIETGELVAESRIQVLLR